ncbi:superoxide dismutase [Verticillium alfalfae VaMs.102]|uniref:Superoxide dismutase n=1 Tax=Verticillium alfalfae (strain VaMs.102 / ATCC MYA-4576 / FGSC 10136) TaxID=526221 RepID=C9SHU6_VERA1|nr:superoxide dismutase [Verticillium alfalfae VaMs.102]EEY18519.1 superoxide dismutase [Verticillium alfalfae VaMs.102]
MVRPRVRLPRVRLAQQLQQRSLHSVPKLDHDFSNGVPGVLSADGFQMAWTEYMTHTLDKLNALTAGTDLETRDTKQIIHATARDPDQAPIFNHASMAHNTHFFFKTLTPTPKPMPPQLAADLSTAFSSLETLRREMTLTAASMFGPGFVWLVKASSSAASTGPSAAGILSSAGGPASSSSSSSAAAGASPSGAEYRILTTYLAGTPYPGAHWRLQGRDMNTAGAAGSASGFLRSTQRASQLGAKPPGSLDLVPLLCLNTWEHTLAARLRHRRASAPLPRPGGMPSTGLLFAEAANIRPRPAFQV